VPYAIYADDPTWVAPLAFERMQHLDPARNPFLTGIEMAIWVATRDGRPVGRISAQVNARHLERYGDGTGHFGFYDAIDDQKVADRLVEVAREWLVLRGFVRMLGPFSPSINDECGLLVEGFETPPAMMMPHGRTWYPRQLEAAGFAKAKDLIAYRIDLEADWRPEPGRLVRRVRSMPGVLIRPLDMRRYRDEIRTICDIFNDAWAENWGFIPFSDEEALYLAKSIRPLVDGRHFAIGQVDGEPAAMVVTLPNLNEAIADLGGKLLPLGWLKLLWRLKVRRLRSGRMPLMGVRRRYHGTPKGAALALGLLAAVREHHLSRGMQWGELSWILEDNAPMNDMILLMGGTPYKRYRIYERAIG
jgi:hypothetical protein